MKKIPHQAKIVLLILILASALLGVLRFDSFQVGGYQDDAYYIVLAESLASGHGFHLINFPDAPVEVAFPPGWPLLLSPLTFLFPGNLSVLKLLAFLLRLASLFLLYKYFGKRIKTPYLEILIALIAFNPFLIGISGMVMSESAYMFFSVLALYLVDKSEEKQENSHHWLLVAAVVVAFYAQLIRTVGLSILLAILAYLLLKRRFRDLGLVVIIFILGLIPQFWFNVQNGGSLISSGYQGQVFNSSVITKIMQMLMNLQSYLGELIANSIIPIFGPNITAAFSNRGLGFIPPLLNIFVLALLALGFFLSAKNFQGSEIYVSIYFLSILAFWKPEIGSTQPRFLIPIIPFFYFYLLQAIVWLAGWLVTRNEKRTSLGVIALSSLFMLILLARNIQDWRDPIRNDVTDLSIGTVWVNQNTPAESIVMTQNPVSDYLYARRKTVAYPSNGQDLEEYLDVNKIDYIIVAPKLQTPRSIELDDYSQNQLLPLIASNPGVFTVVYSNDAHNVTVYHRLDSGP